MAGKPEGYVEVNERIIEFYELFPEGSLQSACTPFMVETGDKAFVVYGAYAYRTPDDKIPGEGWAWEPVPGLTNFTRNSELMNAETSAWGRALAAVGIKVKEGIASANEVRARQTDRSAEPVKSDQRAKPAGGVPAQAPPATSTPVAAGESALGKLANEAQENFAKHATAKATPRQQQDIKDLISKYVEISGESLPEVKVKVRKLSGCSFTDLTAEGATDLIVKLEGWIEDERTQAELGGGIK